MAEYSRLFTGTAPMAVSQASVVIMLYLMLGVLGGASARPSLP